MSTNPLYAFYVSRSRTVDSTGVVKRQMIEKGTGTQERTNTTVNLDLYNDYCPLARCKVFDRKCNSTTKKIPVTKRIKKKTEKRHDDPKDSRITSLSKDPSFPI
jgi:hypothetical protein